MRHMTGVLSAILLGNCLAWPAHALAPGQVDDFEDGTVQGWSVGAQSPFQPLNGVGGPGGADDNFMQLSAGGGNGPGSRLSAFNLGQWAGDYTAAGITAISMDVRNLGPDDVTLRLLLADPVAGPPSNVAITEGVLVQAGSGWTSAVFSLNPASLTPGLGDVNAALSSATELRLFHNPVAAFGGPPNAVPTVNAIIGVDNIRALNGTAVIPEPSSLALIGFGLAALVRRRRS